MGEQLKHEIIFRTPMTEMFSDVLFLSFIRTPLLKNASYAILRINLTSVLATQILNDIADNYFPEYSIEIYTNENIKNEKVRLLFNKLFRVLYLKPLEPISFDKHKIQCYLVLSNPILHHLSLCNKYNTILENKTAYDAISEFERFMSTTHGNIFNFNKVGHGSLKNSFIYEQLLMKTSSDLNIPKFIINNFKPFNSFNFYFWDDFNIDENNDKELTCHHINLYNPDEFEKYDISSYADIIATSKKIKKEPLSDQFSSLDKEFGQTITYCDPNVKYNTEKVTVGTTEMKSGGQRLKTEELVEDRKVKTGSFTSPVSKKTLPQSVQHTNIYAPDSSTISLARFNVFKEFIKNKVEFIQTFETSNCLADWCQFGKLYNMESDNLSVYAYTPIAICNIFIRMNDRQHYCSHMARYSMLKYLK